MMAAPAFDGNDALARAANEVAAIATGPLATSVAIICVAAVGYLAMTGRLPIRRGLTVIIGCFVIFGANSIAAALLDLAGTASVFKAFQTEPQLPPSQFERPPLPPSPPYDPYAGASVLPR